MVAKGATAKGEGSGEGKGSCDCFGCCESGPVVAPDPENCDRWITDIPFLLAVSMHTPGHVQPPPLLATRATLLTLPLFSVDRLLVWDGHRRDPGSLRRRYLSVSP